MTQQAYSPTPLPYLLYLPESYGTATDKKWPLILFLHGSGERGDDPEKIKKYCLPRELEGRTDFPFIVLSPLCPAETRWTDIGSTIIKLLDEIIAQYSIDSRRVYLAGFSMGGEGAWYLGVEYPDRFAAVSPVAGAIPRIEGFIERLCALKNTPVWVFHGTADQYVPFENSQKLVEALKACGGNVQFSVYYGFNHGQTSDATYRDQRLYNWFLTHAR